MDISGGLLKAPTSFRRSPEASTAGGIDRKAVESSKGGTAILIAYTCNHCAMYSCQPGEPFALPLLRTARHRRRSMVLRDQL